MNNYIVLRPTLRFCKGDTVTETELKKYFTQFCIDELIQYGFLDIANPDLETNNN